MSLNKLFRAVALICAVLTMSSAALAAAISVNFTGGQNGNGTGGGSAQVTTTAGAVPVGNWNNEAPASASSVSLIDSTGAATLASLTYSSPNTWAATGSAPGGGGNADLMSGYLDNFQNNGNSISVTGLGAPYTTGGYSVLVYQNADSAGSWGYTTTDSLSNTGTFYGQQLTGGGGNYPLVGTNGFVQSTSTSSAGPGNAANYVRFDNLFGSSFTITANLGGTGDGRVRPNGFQIVSAVPEPASLVLFGLGLLGLLGVGWRARPSVRS